MKIVLPKFPSFQLLKRPWTWVGIILLAILLAVGVSAWPTAKCALGACGIKDQWCNGDCSQTCGPTNGLGIIRDNEAGVLTCDPNEIGGYCVENWHPNYVGVQCTNSANCTVTTVVSHVEEADRLSVSSTQSTWAVGKCTYNPGPKTCSFTRLTNYEVVTCCLGASGSGGGGSCTPDYNPPSISLASKTPENPLVYSQDPDKLGIDVVISAAGGTKSNSCADGDGQLVITSIVIDGVSLSDDSVAWITGVLALRFPGAYIKDSYPLTPTPTINGLNTTRTTASLHFDPLDPGIYDIEVTVIQSDGQTATGTLNVPAYLLDSTITLPVAP